MVHESPVTERSEIQFRSSFMGKTPSRLKALSLRGRHSPALWEPQSGGSSALSSMSHLTGKCRALSTTPPRTDPLFSWSVASPERMGQGLGEGGIGNSGRLSLADSKPAHRACVKPVRLSVREPLSHGDSRVD